MKIARAVSLVALWGSAALSAGCNQNPVTVPFRSLERSSKVAFICLDKPTSATPGVPPETCHVIPPVIVASSPVALGDYSQAPHMLALVTQTARGEVAVIDITSGQVLDLDPSTPGFNFAPVGTMPTDIVATPAGQATFVSVADPNRPGIFALPTHTILPSMLTGEANKKALTLTTFPACALPAAPGAMTLLSDPSGQAHCPGLALGSEAGAVPSPELDLSSETAHYGRAKLVVTLPEVGAIAVVDAQDLLARPAGSFDPCPIETILPLSPKGGSVALGVSSDAGAGEAGTTSTETTDGGMADAGGPAMDASVPEGGAPSADAGMCIDTPPTAAPEGTFKSRPFEFAYADDGRLFISDDGAPVVHVLDAKSPCSLSEGEPLVPTSASDPRRAVMTTAIAVSPLTTDEKRFVYAVDHQAGSVIVFDVSRGSTSRTPVLRHNTQYTPNEPIDRIAYASPVVSLAFAQQDVPKPATDLTATPGGVYIGTKCDPKKSDDPFQPPADYASPGAGPRTLRGVFAFLTMATGQIGVVDVDDLDAACRRPKSSDSPLLGCDGKMSDQGVQDYIENKSVSPYPAGSDEVSCNMVERHRKRSGNYFTNVGGLHAPSMQTLPSLHDKDGTTLTVDPTDEAGTRSPKLLGPYIPDVLATIAGVKQPSIPEDKYNLTTITGGLLDSSTLSAYPYGGTVMVNGQSATALPAAENWVAFDLREPRAHRDEAWVITYEGQLPGFDGRMGQLRCEGADGTLLDPKECESGAKARGFTFRDSTASFCGRGVQDAALASQGGFTSGDVLSITDLVPDPADGYWAQYAGTTCDATRCQVAFGTPDNPTLLRDREILEAYQGRVVLKSQPVPDPIDSTKILPLTCCFPYPVTYAIRGGGQWIVAGQVHGFQHHVTIDPASSNSADARCVNSCDPTLALLNGRVQTSPKKAGATVEYDAKDPRLFRNTTMQFAVWAPIADKCSDCLRRDMYFSFVEIGGYSELQIPLAANALVAPQSMKLVPGLRQLAVPDALSQGLILVDLNPPLGATANFY